ncbi:DNA gyrase subunit A [Anthropogastromicrobium aceti]|uniref:DNA gyrase subunit A n=1 Tax=Anthropogastromicrobium aceti TaxID=2981768 RepID=UPI0008224CB7|nr:DNA gyrase subunit A [Anthropogastromicrobium aceti]MCU6785482.1 DNA gyrase subunit A [Anthropogastromicrobium aceti]SCJ87713.1 DNA gyrase subunit A [uncultured Lachnospira sp.]
MDETIFDKVQEIDLKKTMEQSYIDYAMSVISQRALPDVRDGLKPVQRRVLYSMIELNNGPDKPHRKCARIVGDTMGKYHPHGDSSIYGALVNMAQEWSTHYPLVDGHGNFGSVDGDGAAAMRYTEARLSKIAMEMLADINKDTVNFSPNFDETEKEPDVLPCRFPNLLCNGTTGIAVGMASNIPPHNIKETIDAVVKMINNRIDENRDTEIEELMSVIQGPDFPTGATIIGRRGIEEAYRTGKGKIIVRAVTNIEPMQNGKNRIVVTELPYGVNKAKLIEKIAELVKDKRVDGITDLADQSSREGMRISIELRRDVNPNVVLNQLMKHTQLQDTFGVIMLALVGGEPRILNIHDMLYYYLQHQEEVVTRRTRYDLSKAQERAHILEGLLIALDHIDRVIEIIRGSANVVAAKASLIEEFGLSDAQSQAIVDMRLRALTGLEQNRLENEYKELEERIAYLQSILGDEKVLLGVIRDELLTIKAKYGDDRKTAIELAEDEFNAEDLIPNEAAVIAMTKLGYIKRMSPDHFKAQNRGGKGIKGMNILDEDYIADLITINNHDYVLFFTNLGRVYQLKGYEIPEASRTARGTAVINLLQLQAGEKVTSILRNEGHESGYLTMATKLGMIKRTNLSEYGNIRKVGLAAISLREGDELIDVHVTDGKRDIIMISHLGQCIRFDENDARATGRVSMGVKGMNLADGDSVIGMQVAEENGELLFVSEMGMGKKTAMSEFKDQNRGGKGIRCYRVNAKTGNLAGVKVYKEGYELMLITTEGTVIRMKTDTIPVLGRDTSGVKLMQVDQENVKVSSIELIEESKEEEFAEASEETVGSKEV